MYDSMDLCLGCKGCKRECPTGIDMAKMKIEFLHHYRKRHRLPLRDRLVAYLPRYAPTAARLGFILNLRDRVPGLAWLSERMLGLSAKRNLPRWRPDYFDDSRQSANAASTGYGCRNRSTAAIRCARGEPFSRSGWWTRPAPRPSACWPR
jgi:Fe-S oxidoreductase